MVNDWNECKIDDLKAPVKGSIAMGPFGSRIKAENFVTAGIPIIKGGQLHGAYVLDSDFDFLTPEKAEELKSSQAYRGDLVITHRGTIGQVSIIPHDSLYEKYVVSQSQLKVSFDTNKINPYFVNYFFRTHIGQHRLLANASQVGVPAISKASTSVKAIMVPCPRLEEQNRVVDYLKALDDKIELNRQMNKTLEAMAQALFKSWFVDFDPVIDNALAAGNSIPDELFERAEQRKTIKQNNSEENQAICSLFPDDFEFSEEIGWIPKGWNIKTISDVTSEIIDHRGKTPKKLGGDWSESGYPAISAKNIKNNKLVRPDTIRFVDKEMYEKWMKTPLEAGDVLMTSEAPLGELYYLNSKVDYLLSQRLYGIRADKVNCTGSYLFYWLQTEIGSAALQNRATGTTVFGIKQSELRKIGVLCPSLKLLEKFETFSKRYLEKMDANDLSTTELSKLRDILLPKLISGEIRIPDATRLVEDV